MKKIIIILALQIAVICQSQTPVFTLGTSPRSIPNGSYIKDNDNILNKFVGIWKFNQNGQVFTVILNKAEMVDLNIYYKDMLKGGYRYVNNNTVVVDTQNLTGTNSRITGAMIWRNDHNKLSLFFYDPERPKMSCEITLTYSNIMGFQKLHWDLVATGYIPTLPGDPTPQFDFRVPTNCELIKQ
jgi:hypothetical protein